MRDSLTSLEEQVTRIAAAQIAGLIAIWTQLHTFEPGLPRSLVWATWAFVLLAILRLAPLVTPRRLARFCASLPVKSALKSGECIDSLGCFGLGLAALGYVIEKV